MTGPGYLDIPNKVQRSLSVRGTKFEVTLMKSMSYIHIQYYETSHCLL